MNLLVDTLPSRVDVAGRQYRINTDFKTCLRVILAFEDNALTTYEKTNIMIANLYPSIPRRVPEAVRAAHLFLNGGQAGGETGGPRLYSFGKDAPLIFAAFRQTHSIDLTTAALHWWEFLALFMDLGSDTTFCNLVSLRKRIKSGKATKEERAAASSLGDMFDVPDVDDRTVEEREIERQFLAVVEQQRQNGNTV